MKETTRPANRVQTPIKAGSVTSGVLQRAPANTDPAGRVPPIVREVLGSPGQPLDAATRAHMEPRFGHDFSRVRIHTDARAAESAQVVNALAYTIGPNIAFGKGRYMPSTVHGQKLLAHELTHVVQQMNSLPSALISFDDTHEREAEAASAAIPAAGPPIVAGRAAGLGLARQTRSYPDVKKEILDELNRNMPVAVLGMLDGLDKKMRDALNADPEINQAIAALPPKTRSIIRKHLLSSTGIPTVIGSVPGEMSRAQFEKIMKDRYRVKIIRTGTFDEQSQLDLKKDSWKAWHPGSSSIIYDWIVEAFAKFEKTFGGSPPVKEIVFFFTHYEKKDGKAVEDPDTPASYGRGQLTVYSSIIKANQIFNLQETLDFPTGEQAVKHNIAHELGHGISEIAMDQPGVGPAGQDPQLYVDYRKAVGWTSTAPFQLFDIQAPGVKDALDQGVQPPADTRIDKSNWYFARWKERPLTWYMTDNPADDFSEAIAVYVNDPARLNKFSPARYKFIDERKAKWGPSGKRRLNIWEAAKKGGQPRTLLPAQ